MRMPLTAINPVSHPSTLQGTTPNGASSPEWLVLAQGTPSLT